MKFLYFHQHFSTPQGSAGTRSYEFAQRLIGRGHSVTLVCGSYGGGISGLTGPFSRGRRRGFVDGIDVIEFNLPYSNHDNFLKRSVTFAKFGLRSIGAAMSSDYDLVFATTTPLTAGIPGIAARWLRRKPFVFEVRDLWPELPRAMGVITNPIVLGAMSVLEWASYRSAHLCIGLAPGIVEGIKKRGVRDEHVRFIPNGCDLEQFGAATGIARWRPEGVAKSDLMAVFAGAHGMANGLHALLDAAKVLKDRNRTDIKLVLVGGGKLKPLLMERAARDGLSNCIFLNPVPKGKLAGLLADTDVGLMLLANVPAFYFGTSPNKFFDYIAAGVPVLNNYPGWIAGMLEKNGCGVAIPPDDPAAFALALEGMADDRAALAAMAIKSRALAERDFDRHVLADQFADELERVAGR